MPLMDHNRRKYPRLKLAVPVELYVGDSDSPIRGATADLSLSGCYIESIFPFPVGATLEIKLQLEETLLIVATVVTCDPQVGNGVRFDKMLPDDADALGAYLAAAEKEAAEKSPQ
jgi:c-di-GMP-binding flagellar brake protein YcgR